jgi:hypothetical protein
VDAEFITFAALTQLSKRDKFDRAKLPGVIRELNINPEKPSALYA